MGVMTFEGPLIGVGLGLGFRITYGNGIRGPYGLPPNVSRMGRLLRLLLQFA